MPAKPDRIQSEDTVQEPLAKDCSGPTRRELIKLCAGALVASAPAARYLPAEVPMYPATQTGPAALHFDTLPFLKGAKTFQWSSWSRPEVFDPFYADPDGYGCILDIKGPGVITHFWSTDMDSAILKFYFDGATTPQLTVPVSEFCGGKLAPFLEPMATITHGGGHHHPSCINFYQLAFRTCVRVTASKVAFWHFITEIYPTAEGIRTWTGKEDYGADRQMWANAGIDPKSTAGNRTVTGSAPLPIGITTVIYDRKGKESIASIRIKPGTNEVSILSKTWIRCYWDGSAEPQVNAPLDFFFGAADTILPYKSLPSGAEPYYIFFPMPYWKSARIEVVNESSADYDAFDYSIEYRPSESMHYPEHSCGYFCATYNHGNVSTGELNYIALEVEGQGQIVGLVKGGRATGESDEEVYIDGNLSPQYCGSGGEDMPLFSWGLWAGQYPLWGSTNGQNYYRYYIPDNIVFHNRIRFGLEHHENWREAWKNNSLRSDDYGWNFPQTYPLSSLCFYYWRPEKEMLLTDSLDIGDQTSETAHKYRVVGQTWSGVSKYSYEAERYLEVITDSGRRFDGFSEFTVRLDPSNTGVQLRRRAEQNGIQEAKVYVDGKEVTESRFYSPVHRPSTNMFYQSGQLWRDFEFEIPRSYTQGKSTIQIRIVNTDSALPGHSNWSEYYYWVYSHLGWRK